MPIGARRRWSNRGAAALFDAVTRLERSSRLDTVASRLRVPRPLAHGRPANDVLSGTPVGHPVHPLLVTFPLGCWTSALLLDVNKKQRSAARQLVGVGVLATAPAAVAGFLDWSDTDVAERRVGLVHAGANAPATPCFGTSWWARRDPVRGGTLWALAGAACAGVAGWLGGHLVYGHGVGVDTNAFETGPQGWTTVAGAFPSLGAAQRVVGDGVGIAMFGTDRGVYALADRCSHRGGPLSEGGVEGSCIVCPWHQSAFDGPSGRPERGPATIPQPAYEWRLEDGALQVQRDEARGLRTRATRPGAST